MVKSPKAQKVQFMTSFLSLGKFLESAIAAIILISSNVAEYSRIFRENAAKKDDGGMKGIAS